MVEPPGQQGLVERLAAMERRIEELSRRGGGGSQRLARVRLTATAGQINFTNIPQYGYENLQLVISAGSTHTAYTGLKCRLNGATSGYDVQFIEGNGTGYNANRSLDVAALEVGVLGPTTWTITSTSEAIIADYTGDQWKILTARSAYLAANATLRQWSAAGHYWGGGQPVTQLTLYPGAGQFKAGSTATIYGLT